MLVEEATPKDTGGIGSPEVDDDHERISGRVSDNRERLGENGLIINVVSCNRIQTTNSDLNFSANDEVLAEFVACVASSDRPHRTKPLSQLGP